MGELEITKGTVTTLFNDMGFVITDMVLDRKYNVSELGYRIRTPNGFERVLSIIRKKDDYIYQLVTNDFLLKGAGNHLVCVADGKNNLFWKTLSSLEGLAPLEFRVVTVNGLATFFVSPIYKKSLILDIEVEGSHSYFTDGILSHNTIFGNPETTTGGEALKFYASIRLDIRKKDDIKTSAEVIGNSVKVTVKKNKVAPPFRIAEYDIYYDEGISRVSELIKIGTDLGYVEKSGGWYTMGEERFHGEQDLRGKLKTYEGIAWDLENRIRFFYGLPLWSEE